MSDFARAAELDERQSGERTGGGVDRYGELRDQVREVLRLLDGGDFRRIVDCSDGDIGGSYSCQSDSMEVAEARLRELVEEPVNIGIGYDMPAIPDTLYGGA